MEKNGKEKQLLYEWGIENNQTCHFQQADQSRESYFIKRQDSSYIKEYSFETFPQFLEELSSLWNDDEMMESVKKAIGVAAIKNKPIKITASQGNEENKNKVEDELPAYIYNF